MKNRKEKEGKKREDETFKYPEWGHPMFPNESKQMAKNTKIKQW